MLERETEQRNETFNDEWLKAVYVMGVILFFAPPVLFSLLVFAMVLIPAPQWAFDIPAEYYISFAGLVAIAYASIKLRKKDTRFKPCILAVEIINWYRRRKHHGV